MGPIRDGPSSYSEFVRYSAEAADLFIKRLVPAALPVRTRLLLAASRQFVREVCMREIPPPSAACLRDPHRLQEVREYQRPFLGAVQKVAYDYLDALLPVPPIAEGAPGQQWRPTWPYLSVANRMTIAYWLMPHLPQRAAVCLRHELDMDGLTIQTLTDCPTPGSTHTFVSRACDALREQYERLERMNSPPFPGLFQDIFDERDAGPPWPRDRQQLLIGTVAWLQQQPF